MNTIGYAGRISRMNLKERERRPGTQAGARKRGS
jgi:hypothetical protein